MSLPAVPIFNGTYQPSGAPTLAVLKAIQSPGGVVTLIGRDSPGDGLGGTFFWDGTSTATGDDAYVVTPTGYENLSGRWLRYTPAVSSSNYGLFSGEADSTDYLTACFTAAQGTLSTVYLGAGDYYFSSQLPDINGFCLEMDPNARLIATAKMDMRIKVTGENSAIIGGQIINRACRSYRISYVSQPGGAGTTITFTLLAADLADADLGAHSFIVGDSIRIQCARASAGTLCDSDKTITAVTSNTVSIAGTGITVLATTYPYDPLDGHGRSIYPFLYLARSNGYDEANIMVRDATDFLVRGVQCKWSASGWMRVINSHHGRIEHCSGRQVASDGLSMNYRCHDIDVHRCETWESQDALFSLLGLKNSGSPIYRVRFTECNGGKSWGKGRGYDFVGTSDCSAEGGYLEDVWGSAIYCKQDSSNNSYGNHDYRFANITARTVGCDTNWWPTGWNATNYAGITLGGGSPEEDQDLRGVIEGVVIHNCRYRGMTTSGATTRQAKIDVKFVECAQHVITDLLLIDSKINLKTDRSGGNAMFLSAANASGVNTYDLNYSNINRGQRRWLYSASVASGTLTLDFLPGVSTSAMTAGVSIVVDAVGSGYDQDTNETTETAKDFAINGTYTVATRSVGTGALGGDVLTITGTGLSDTTHASCYNPDQPCPVAYAALTAGLDSSYDGFNIGASVTGYHKIDSVVHGEQLYTFNRPWEIDSTQWHKVWIGKAKAPAGGAAISGTSAVLGEGYHQASSAISADSDQTMGVHVLRTGFCIRSGATAARTDTTRTAAEHVASFPGVFPGMRWQMRYWNVTGVVITIAGGSGVTISGTATIAPGEMAIFEIDFATVTAGSEAVTWIRAGMSGLPVIATANLPAAASAMNGKIVIEDAGAGDRNLIVYAGGERFRIDGGATF